MILYKINNQTFKIMKKNQNKRIFKINQKFYNYNNKIKIKRNYISKTKMMILKYKNIINKFIIQKKIINNILKK